MRTKFPIFFLSVAVACASGACAARTPAPKPAPMGRGWRTLHQGYVAAEASSSTQQYGNYQVTTTTYAAKRKVYENQSSNETPRLTKGATVTRALLEKEARR